MTTIYGVFIKGSTVPMAFFRREDWADEFRRKMEKRNPSVPLVVIHRRVEVWT